MDQETRNLINIIKSGVTNEAIDISGDFSLDHLVELACKHNIFTLVHCGMHNCNVAMDDQLKAKFSNVTRSCLYISEQQLYYIQKISTLFDENNIDYMLLKGSVLKHFYPQPEVRRMGDIDILIKEVQYSKISKILEGLGFTFRNESDHELTWSKNKIVIELHKILMPSYNKDLHNYFGDGWKRAVKVAGNRYTFSDDDMFIYIFSHFAKHYRDAGIGITHMCDLYVYLKAKTINEEYIRKELKTLGLYDFYCNIKSTLEVWFENKDSDAMTDHITAVILNSGTYGLHENTRISTALKEKKVTDNVTLGKIHRIWVKIFPSYKGMKTKYQILKRWPILLPVFWIVRLVDLTFFRGKDISKNLDDICAVSEQEIDEYETALNYVGLDYNF